MKKLSSTMNNLQRIQDLVTGPARTTSTINDYTEFYKMRNSFIQQNTRGLQFAAEHRNPYIKGISSIQRNLEGFQSVAKQIQTFQDIAARQTKLNSFLNSITYSSPIIQALQNIKIPASSFEVLSTIDFDEIEPFFELDDIQEEIQQEITALREETSLQKIYDSINKYSEKLLEYPTTVKEKAPAVFILLFYILPIILQLTLVPSIQDKIKEAYNTHETNNPKENAKQIKSSLENDFGMALETVNKIRVTNRETPVSRSNHRYSGTIDSIPHNKPVIIIKKKRNWSFVMYTNSLGDELSGWVFTGNLTK